MPSEIEPTAALPQAIGGEVLEFRSAHDRKLDSLGPAHAALVRRALIRADAIRRLTGYETGSGQADPGRAYLEDFTDRLAA